MQCSESLLPNMFNFKKLSAVESFKACKRQNVKQIYRLKMGGEEKYSERKILSKIMKLNVNGFAMKK